MKVEWTRLALQDVRSLRSYLVREKVAVADSILRQIRESVGRLEEFPEIGRMGRVKGTRELIILGTPYIVPYRFRENQIEILAVIHGARRWPDVLS